MAAFAKPTPGETLDARFRVLEEIGHGGMATVFKAEDLEQHRLVALKVPLPQFASGLGSWSMYQREAEIGLRLDHPGIVRTVAATPGKGRSYVVTEYIEGVVLAARVGNGRRLTEPVALRITRQLCAAVAYMHAQGVVHYDLKPSNVIVRPDGSVCLIDLGVAHAIAKKSLFSGAAPPLASAEYVAPEQLRRVRGQTSVDIYALGAMLYELLTGHPPFEGDDPFVIASARQIGDPIAPRALCPTLSAQVEEIVLHALRRDPRERFATVAELQDALERPGAVQLSGLAERLVAVTPWRKHLRRLRYVALVGLLPIAGLVASFRLLWWYLESKH